MAIPRPGEPRSGGKSSREGRNTSGQDARACWLKSVQLELSRCAGRAKMADSSRGQGHGPLPKTSFA
eukprot:3490871-Alexandrium_andersonii.AAC.1